MIPKLISNSLGFFLYTPIGRVLPRWEMPKFSSYYYFHLTQNFQIHLLFHSLNYEETHPRVETRSTRHTICCMCYDNKFFKVSIRVVSVK